MNRFVYAFIVVLLISSSGFALERSHMHHELKVKIDPASHKIEAEDTVRLTEALEGELVFYLHGNLEITVFSQNVKITEVENDEEASIPLKKYNVTKASDADVIEFTIKYSGEIYHPIKQMSEEYERSFSTSQGVISNDGVYLSGSSVWIPWMNDDIYTFNLKVKLPDGWMSVSEGNYVEKTEDDVKYEVWESPEPMDQIYLIAAKFTKYKITTGDVDILAYLRTPDKNLANTYLETTKQYLDMYEKLLGEYPFTKFALVENFWETGYGMPSFTLLGSQIIRFPFILHSSYPHELLHNWWGNSVYVDYQSGNWCEGLTAYLADHLIREQHGQGADYRRTTLQGFTDYVNEANDFPLTDFRSRHNASSASIGYGKSLFVYHMLRKQVGDKLFTKAMQKFYADNKYKHASFDDIRKAFDAVTGENYEEYFNQWVTRKGAPELGLEDVKVAKKDSKYVLTFELNQYQNEDAFNLYIPIRIYLDGSEEAVDEFVTMTEKSQNFEFSFDQPVLRIDVDPEFDVFRKLHFKEIPPTLSKAFGAEEILIVLPSQVSEKLLEGYRSLAQSWAGERSEKIQIIMDNELNSFPINKAVWLFGWENLYRNVVSDGIVTYGATAKNSAFFVEGKSFNQDENSIVISARNPINPKQVVVLMSTDQADALPGLGRKLPHYGKYSYLGFEGAEPTNNLKGQWVETSTPLSAVMNPDKIEETKQIKTLKSQALAYLPPSFLKENMLETIKSLTSSEMQGREIASDGVGKAAKFIANKFKEYGLQPGGDATTYYQTWTQKVDKFADEVEMKNIVGVIPGKNPQFKGQAVIVCAHYDHIGMGENLGNAENKGKMHPGADDNASGVAVLLELARKLADSSPDRTIIFIAFSGEEYGRLGSIHYVSKLTEQERKSIIGVVNIDGVGRLNDQKLMVLGGNSAREWKFIFMGIEYTAGIGSELLTQDIESGDHSSFLAKGIPAIQVFTGAHEDYHKPSDTLDKIDGEGLVKVAAAVREIVVYLSQRPEFMNVQIENKKHDDTKKPTTSRSVGTGIMPDFRFDGTGVKVGSVSKDSPAEKAGLQKGDVIVKVGDTEITDLKQYSQELKKYQPDDETTIEYMRKGEKFTTKIKFKAR